MLPVSLLFKRRDPLEHLSVLTPARSSLALAAALLVGCGVDFAPPVHTGSLGAPGRLREGDLEAGGSVSLFQVGGPNVAYAASDVVAIEGGGEFLRDGWSGGYAGTRLTWNGRRRDGRRGLGNGPALDGAIGFGLGVADSTSGSSRVYGGPYGDLGASYHEEWIAPYVHFSVQGSFGPTFPTTFWHGEQVGLEAYYGPLSVYAATGLIGFTNDTGQVVVWNPIEAGLQLHFNIDANPFNLRRSTERAALGKARLVEQP